MEKTLDISRYAIYEDGRKCYGADQHWFKNKLHGLSGCGPTTAALITMYMAQKFENCRPLYSFDLPAEKEDFTVHMQEVREYVKPGLKGLTDAGFFASSTQEFADSRGVKLSSRIVSGNIDANAAFKIIAQAIDEGLMPALLILKNPSPEIDEFTWHWMAVTGYDDESMGVVISTYSKKFVLDFEKVWIQYGHYRAEAVIILPD